MEIEIVNFIIHADGFVIETRKTTDESEAFLVDLFDWSTKEFGLAKPADLPIKKIYSSEINFSLSKPIKLFNPALADFFADANGFTGTKELGPSEPGLP